MESLFQENLTELNHEGLPRSRAKLYNALAIEESFWQQKARSHWLMKGNRNTSYFHNKVKKRRLHSVIHGMKSETGEWIIANADICPYAIDFFTGFY